MPKRYFKNHGWGVDPKAEGREAEELTGSHACCSWSEYSYIGTDRNTKTFTCGCNPDLPPPTACADRAAAEGGNACSPAASGVGATYPVRTWSNLVRLRPGRRTVRLCPWQRPVSLRLWHRLA
ncbi:unnamed protein product, partial [Pylaiella littoralis]